jgi:hypothetical protein
VRDRKLKRVTYLVLGQVVGEVGNHDLGLGGNAILGRSTLLLGAAGAGLTLLLSALGGSSVVLVGGVSQRSLLGGVGLGGFLALLSLGFAVSIS